MVNHSKSVVRLDRTVAARRDRFSKLRQRQGSLQTRYDERGGCPRRSARVVAAPPLPENLQTTAGHGGRSQGRAARSARRSLAQEPQRVLWLGLLGHLYSKRYRNRRILQGS